MNYCILLPRGAKLAGLYHTHVASSELSPRDRSNAERVGVPSFVGLVRDGTVLVYDGRTRKTVPLRDTRHNAPTTSRHGVADLWERLAAMTRRVARFFEAMFAGED